MPKMKIALISPNKNEYSETFIQAHKNRLNGEVSYYYGGYLPSHHDGSNLMFRGNIIQRIWRKIIYHARKKAGLTSLSLAEEALVRSLKKRKIEVVLAEYGPTGCHILPVCEKLQIPLVVHFHGIDASLKSLLYEYKDRYKAMFEYASFVIVVSRPMQQALTTLGAPEDKLVYNPYGPDEKFIEVIPTYSEKALMCVGRFVDKKAPYYSILAFSKTLQEYPDAILYMAGEGPLLNVCKNLVKYLKIEENVQFLGVITPDQYREKLSTVRAFVQHSITADNGDMEGSPVAIIEAQAAGVPVISTKHAGIPEIVAHGESGWLVEEGDVEGMAKYMKILLEDLHNAKKFGQKGREVIQEKFTAFQHIEILNQCIEESAKKIPR